MDNIDRKKIAVIQKYIEENFSEGDWASLESLTNSSEIINYHPRLFRAMRFGDTDYGACVVDVINQICEKNPENLETIIDFFDIDMWFEQKDFKKYERIFQRKSFIAPQFWKNGYLKIFISHLATSKIKARQLKKALESWGMSCFVAHEDIEPTKEWMNEIESALNSMDALVAMVEPKFKESNWTDQEIGFALGRQIEIIPLRIGADPHGFMGKYQGIQAKDRFASDLGSEIFKILIKKPKFRSKLISALFIAFQTMDAKSKVSKIKEIESMNLLNESEMKELLEKGCLDTSEKTILADLIKKYKAFAASGPLVTVEDDLPF